MVPEGLIDLETDDCKFLGKNIDCSIFYNEFYNLF